MDCINALKELLRLRTEQFHARCRGTIRDTKWDSDWIKAHAKLEEAEAPLLFWLCDHEWVGHKNPDTVHGPGEWVEYCKKCGCENQGSYVPE